jgi:hypothetical protein
VAREDGFVARFQALHEKAKRGERTAEERAAYEEACGELAQALVQGEGRTLGPGQTWRSALVVVRALLAEVQLPAGKKLRTVTTEISLERVCVVAASSVALGAVVSVRLLAAPGVWIEAPARVVSTLEIPPRLTLAFDGLSSAGRERLEIVLFDTVLSAVSPS